MLVTHKEKGFQLLETLYRLDLIAKLKSNFILLIIVSDSIVKVINIIYLRNAKLNYRIKLLNMTCKHSFVFLPIHTNGLYCTGLYCVHFLLSIINNMYVSDVNYCTISYKRHSVTSSDKGLNLPLARSFLENT